jgi:hypothetical protein
VRSRLLDFLLEFKDLTASATSEDEIKKRIASENVMPMFNNAIFGPNATVIVGHHNTQQITKSISKGDFDSLVRSLIASGVPEEEIGKLRAATLEDQRERGEPALTGKTGAWFTGLLESAGKGALKVGTDVVSGAVSKALMGFLGFS